MVQSESMEGERREEEDVAGGRGGGGVWEGVRSPGGIRAPGSKRRGGDDSVIRSTNWIPAHMSRGVLPQSTPGVALTRDLTLGRRCTQH